MDEEQARMNEWMNDRQPVGASCLTMKYIIAQTKILYSYAFDISARFL